jgi:hypothetical protein
MRLRRTRGQRVRHALALMIVLTSKHSEEVRVSNERGFPAQGRLVGSLDEHAPIELRLSVLSTRWVRENEDVELGVAEQQARAGLLQRGKIHGFG